MSLLVIRLVRVKSDCSLVGDVVQLVLYVLNVAMGLCLLQDCCCGGSMTSTRSESCLCLCLGVRLTLGRSLHSAERKGHYT